QRLLCPLSRIADGEERVKRLADRGREIEEDFGAVHRHGVDAQDGFRRDETHQELVHPKVQEAREGPDPEPRAELDELREKTQVWPRESRGTHRHCESDEPANRHRDRPGERRRRNGESDGGGEHPEDRGVDPRGGRARDRTRDEPLAAQEEHPAALVQREPRGADDESDELGSLDTRGARLGQAQDHDGDRGGEDERHRHDENRKRAEKRRTLRSPLSGDDPHRLPRCAEGSRHRRPEIRHAESTHASLDAYEESSTRLPGRAAESLHAFVDVSKTKLLGPDDLADASRVGYDGDAARGGRLDNSNSEAFVWIAVEKMARPGELLLDPFLRRVEHDFEVWRATRLALHFARVAR